MTSAIPTSAATALAVRGVVARQQHGPQPERRELGHGGRARWA